MVTLRKFAAIAALLLLGVFVSGCQVATNYARFKNLDVRAKMEDAPILPPVASDQKTCWLEIRSSAGVHSIPEIRDALNVNCSVVQDANRAHYWVQIRLQVNKADVYQADKIFRSPIFTGVLAGAAGAAAGAHLGQSYGATAGGALAAIGLVLVDDFLANMDEFKPLAYVLTAEVQISERTTNKVAQRHVASVKQGKGSRIKQEVSEPAADRKLYRAGIRAQATKINLQKEEALQALITAFNSHLSTIF